VVVRGYGVPDAAARLGVSAHSLNKWVKAASPDRSEQQTKELLEAKSEVLRLRSQLRRVEEEREPQKSRTVPCQGARVNYRFMSKYRRDNTIFSMCRVLRVTRTGFYASLHEPVGDHAMTARLSGFGRLRFNAPRSGVSNCLPKLLR
jgi:transposase-like protein